jgi:hypothetical protein
MSFVYARDMLGAESDLVAAPQAGKLLIGAAQSSVISTLTARRASPITLNGQTTLALTTGWHVGPLFIVQKRRAPVIHGGTLGGKRRRARERRNTPKWADLAAIRAMYNEAARLTKSDWRNARG